MTIYSLYIFDRHCDCVYYHDWHRTRPVRATPNDRPAVHRLSAPQGAQHARESIFSARSATTPIPPIAPSQAVGAGSNAGLPFDEEAKLVYGVVLSLRNMVKKLSGKDEAFTSYKTPQYRLHLYETLTGYKFVLLSDPFADSLRFVLRQLYTGPFIEFVVRNPLIEMDSRTQGIDNDQFRGAVDRHVRGLSIFA
ncbi:Transport protein particle subunit bet5 [Vanrija pseudolonga]|uniref:Trafficking protein particle complex subunit n=1 Tax=Vanrija pseudolonga TaxID=143232 RepID=A0AAF0YGJ4_9TREE|nr:Transport protein particle subunit bet5 [Vanrija pseudolonga]